jgi:D-3-phosphoglycerate dehydrogenase
MIAEKRGIKVIESKTTTSDDFASLISLKVKSLEDENIISGTIFGKSLQRILRINDFYLEAIPEGHNLLIHNLDIPGMIGRIATLMGEHGINIARMAVGQEKGEKQNVILLTTDVSIDDGLLEELSNLENIFSVRRIEL